MIIIVYCCYYSYIEANGYDDNGDPVHYCYA